jgi:hypothetical protein
MGPYFPDDQHITSTPTTPSTSRTVRWKPDHLLTRDERNQLRWEAREINIYDLGWRVNLRHIFLGVGAEFEDDEKDVRRDKGGKGIGFRDIMRGMWPLIRGMSR